MSFLGYTPLISTRKPLSPSLEVYQAMLTHERHWELKPKSTLNRARQASLHCLTSLLCKMGIYQARHRNSRPLSASPTSPLAEGLDCDP